jgi:phosphotransferase system enzyme I (PtsP)
VPAEKLKGILCQRGSSMSHAAIIANSLNIPAVMGLEDLPLTWLHGETVIVDGYQGRVFISPNQSVISEFRRLIREEQQLTSDLSTLQDKPSVTTDGYVLPLYSNIGALSEFQMTSVPGADGIGLYRTEFTFMLRNSFPSEEEQFKRYAETLASSYPRPVNIRILDIGADKPLPYFTIDEDNSFLGWRGIRVMLDHPEILLTQLRAMLRAHHAHGNLQIVLPMVTYISEIKQTIEFIKSAQKSLLEKGIEVDIPPLGVMIEVPAIIYQIEKMKGLVEFLSIGTNDLAQYILAVDRNNPKVSGLFQNLHPVILETLQGIVRRAKSVNLPVSVCGEIAGDPVVALLLLGMGMNGLSMTAASIPRVKWVVRSFSYAEARNLLEIAMTMDNGHAIREMLNEALTSKGMGGIIRAGRK